MCTHPYANIANVLCQASPADVSTLMSDTAVSAAQAPFDAAYFNSVFGNVYDQRDTLLRTALLLKPGN